MTMTQDMGTARQRIADLLPVEAVHHGWNLVGLDYSVDRSGEERWSVGLLGPVEAYTREEHILAGPVVAMLMVDNGTHGRLTARTFDDLCRLVGEWISVVWGSQKGDKAGDNPAQ